MTHYEIAQILGITDTQILGITGIDLFMASLTTIKYLYDEFDLDEIIRESNYSFDAVKEKIRDTRRICTAVRATETAGTSASSVGETSSREVLSKPRDQCSKSASSTAGATRETTPDATVIGGMKE